jgi:hypothetical protein
MIIRNINGELIQINKYSLASDTIYYEKIMNIKKEFTKSNVNSINTKKYSKTKDLIYNFINIKTTS